MFSAFQVLDVADLLRCSKLTWNLLQLPFPFRQGLTKTGDDYEVKAAHVELAERMRKVIIFHQFNMSLS